jgi:hypothetical protein
MILPIICSNCLIVPAVSENHQRRLASVQAFLDYNACACVSKDPLNHHGFDCRVEFSLIVCDAHAFARGQAVGLDDDWELILGSGGVVRCLRRVADREPSRGN